MGDKAPWWAYALEVAYYVAVFVYFVYLVLVLLNAGMLSYAATLPVVLWSLSHAPARFRGIGERRND